MHRKNINIIAPNIKSGGGLELLLYLLDIIEKKYLLNVVLHIDKSLEKNIIQTSRRKIVFYGNSFKKIHLFTKRIDNSLYFGNLPPLVKTSNSILYIHNSYLIMGFLEFSNTSFNLFIKYYLQQLYIRTFINNCGITACQTETMFRLIKSKFKPKQIQKLPFFRECVKSHNKQKEYDFCYISLAHPHKNHKLLFKAAHLLNKYKIKCTVALTIETEKKELIDEINLINQAGYVHIVNLGIITKSEVCDVYNKTNCLIFPSTKESFGLPLIEAAKLNLDVISPQLDYVNDIIIPTMSFESNNEKDLADKMKTYLLPPQINKPKLLIDNEVDKIIKKLAGL